MEKSEKMKNNKKILGWGMIALFWIFIFLLVEQSIGNFLGAVVMFLIAISITIFIVYAVKLIGS